MNQPVFCQATKRRGFLDFVRRHCVGTGVLPVPESQVFDLYAPDERDFKEWLAANGIHAELVVAGNKPPMWYLAKGEKQ